MRHTLQLTLLALLVSTASLAIASDSDKWVKVGELDIGIFSIKKDSFENTTTRGGDRIAVVIGRSLSTKTKQISLEKWYVRVADCYSGHGQLATLTIDGEFKYENSWVEDGGSIASSIASVICGVHKWIADENEKKGI